MKVGDKVRVDPAVARVYSGTSDDLHGVVKEVHDSGDEVWCEVAIEGARPGYEEWFRTEELVADA